ncbi:rhamnogalacturonan acetylesterase [Lignipirellula cremea]|uniref:Rhamnogalacturonan acetylesterase RhgT n=1 Tax=Lignipirellula cremea TaxID=2528010 RepID=A0A518E0V9_9BACT|nr:rhamnogalacturonan acetylesterase [Lignipirellula cremea]QDU97723.1 Rhamnogalacturonan acetylesterase RhgT [Lignipirellula cremea]
MRYLSKWTPGLAVALAFLLGGFEVESALAVEGTIWLIGDSTVASYPAERDPVAGWGQLLGEYCKEGVVIQNKAVSGTTSRSFVSRKFWEKVLPQIKEGDYVFIQFGHNDHYKERGEHLVSADDFKTNLAGYVAEIRGKGATPVLVTPMCRRIFDANNKIKKQFANYPEKVIELGREEKVAVIDLEEISFQELGKLTVEETKDVFLYLPAGKYPAFPDGKKDGVHFQTHGARLLAGWVVEDAKKQKLPIAQLFQ